MNKSSKVLQIIRILLAIGLVGVLAIKTMQLCTGISGNDLFNQPIWIVIILITASSFFISFLILFPVFIFLKLHEVQTTEGILMPWWAPLAIVLGFTNPNWLIPKTISAPIVIIMSILIGFLTYTVVMSLIFGYFLK